MALFPSKDRLLKLQRQIVKFLAESTFINSPQFTAFSLLLLGLFIYYGTLWSFDLYYSHNLSRISYDGFEKNPYSFFEREYIEDAKNTRFDSTEHQRLVRDDLPGRWWSRHKRGYTVSAYNGLYDGVSQSGIFTGRFLLEPLKAVFYASTNVIQNALRYGAAIRFTELWINFLSLWCFTVLSIRYNLPTGWLIMFINHVAAKMWLAAIVDQLRILRQCYDQLINYQWRDFRFPEFQYINGETSRDDYRLAYSTVWHQGLDTLSRELGVHKEQPLKFFTENLFKSWGSIPIPLVNLFTRFTDVRLVTHEDYSEYINFHCDPISLFLIDNDFYDRSSTIGGMHTFFFEYCAPFLTGFGVYVWLKFFTIFTYALVVRRLKDFTPYLWRWHWTTIFILKMGISSLLFPIFVRYMTWLIRYEQPQINHLVHINDSNVEIRILLYVFYSSILLSGPYVIMFSYTLASLHAVFGQYFYIPGITPHVELHVGQRKELSIYSGGLMDWQKYEVGEVRFSWYGIFGRGRDKKSILLMVFDTIKNLFMKFFKKLFSFFKSD